jgi:hypothetical protein
LRGNIQDGGCQCHNLFTSGANFMQIAVISDMHANNLAFETVLLSSSREAQIKLSALAMQFREVRSLQRWFKTYGR